jgi:type I restriction enzyme S subunit
MSSLPTGWTLAKIKETIGADGLFTDGDWVESKDQDPHGGIRLLQLADIGDGRFIDKSDRYINDIKFVELRCTELNPGDVLVARMPDPLGRACLMPELLQRCITVVDVAAIRSGKYGVNHRWLVNAINSPQVRREIETQSSGTTRRRISRGNLSEIAVPVPPIEEQTRIADKLDTVLARVDACRDRLARVAPLLKRFRQSVLAAATSGRLTEDWRGEHGLTRWRFAVSMSEVGTIGGGLTKNSKRDEYSEVRPYLRVANVHANQLRLDEISSIGVLPQEFTKTRLQKGDLLIVEGNGSIDHIGRVAIWNDEIPDISHQNHLIRWRANKDIDPRFVLYWVLSPIGREQIVKVASSTTGLHTLSVSKVGALSLDLPPLDEQTEIVRRVEILFTFADRLEARLTHARAAADRLTPAMLAKAFRGELVPQDPEDEPAAELLKRLAAGTLQNSAKRTRRSSTAGAAPAPTVKVPTLRT